MPIATINTTAISITYSIGLIKYCTAAAAWVGVEKHKDY